MPTRTSVQQLSVSAWAFQVFADVDDVSNLDKELLEQMRTGAMERMSKAQDLVVKEWKVTLSRVYPLIRPANVKSTPDRMLRAIRISRAGRDHREPAPSGQPPGRIMGDLQRAVKKGRRAWNKARTVLTGRVFNDHPGAGRLEWGGKGIQPHPHYRTTLVRIEPQLGAILEGIE